MIKYWKFIFIQILVQASIIIIIHAAAVTAVAEETTTKYTSGKFSTAHSFPNNTVYIVGGVDMTTTENGLKIFDLNQTDYSLHYSLSTTKEIQERPGIIGHTSHVHVPTNTIITVFGMQANQTESPALVPMFKQPQGSIPTGRYKHSSLLINNEILYVIGGEKVNEEKKLIESQDMIWNYSFSTNTWKRYNHHAQQQYPAMAGHISLVYHQWIVSCFGYYYKQDISLLHDNSCIWFDTNTLNTTTIISSSTISWPSARKYSNLVSIGKDQYILYGGEKEKEILSDVWKLHVNDTFKMRWERVNSASDKMKRSGHASTLLSQDNMILYYGGQQQETDPIYLNLSNMEWIQPNHHHLTRISRHDVIEAEEETKKKLNGGIIAAIIIGILVIFGLFIAFLVWKKRVNRQQSIHQQSRAARFSHSPPVPMQSVQEDYNNSSRRRSSNGLPPPPAAASHNLVTLPEIALSRHSNKSHTSVVSVDGQVQAQPQPEIIEEEEEEEPVVVVPPNRDYKRRESTGFKRLTLNLFSSQQQDESVGGGGGAPVTTTKKSSNIFQLRSSKLLLQATTNDSMNKALNNNSRISVGAKSVSSVQWVGFNDNMDYKGNNWRDSSNSSMHLAVTNAQRASSYYTNESTTSTPKSPLFASHLRDSSAIHYQLSETDTTHGSWKSDHGIDSTSSNITTTY